MVASLPSMDEFRKIFTTSIHCVHGGSGSDVGDVGRSGPQFKRWHRTTSQKANKTLGINKLPVMFVGS